jgi:hypothetical protein
VRGGAGADPIRGAAVADGGAGNDVIESGNRPPTSVLVRCGAGHDVVAFAAGPAVGEAEPMRLNRGALGRVEIAPPAEGEPGAGLPHLVLALDDLLPEQVDMSRRAAR